MRKSLKCKVFVFLVCMVFWITGSSLAFAREENGRDRHSRHQQNHHRNHQRSYHRDSHHHHSYPYGKTVVSLPGGYISVIFSGGRHYYSGGVFYKRRHRDYVVVEPPRGIVVRRLPAGCRYIKHRGHRYYTARGVYYKPVGGGYLVVDPPPADVIELENDPGVIVNANEQNITGPWTVNIPNSTGGYTAVTLKASNGGYVGPQGEFYAEFPKVEQLRVMYAS